MPHENVHQCYILESVTINLHLLIFTCLQIEDQTSALAVSMDEDNSGGEFEQFSKDSRDADEKYDSYEDDQSSDLIDEGEDELTDDSEDEFADDSEDELTDDSDDDHEGNMYHKDCKLLQV